MAKHTKLQILDTAECLFAEQGYGQTSMRAITAGANVNLASVNYHFGSKKNLIQAVLKRYFDVLMPAIDNTIASVSPAPGVAGVESFIQGLISPMLQLNQVRDNGTEMFVQLLGRGYTESQGHLRRFIMQTYGTTVHNMVARIQQSLPEVEPKELFWRLHFAFGSFVFSMASIKALTDIAAADYQLNVEIEDVLQRLVPFVTHGMAGSTL